MFDDDEPNPYETADVDPYNYDYKPPTIPPPPTTAGKVSSRSTMDEESLQHRIQDVERREMEVSKRERELAITAESLGAGGEGRVDDGPKKNFPLCYPIVYHSIWAIKNNHRRVNCLLGFIAWILFSLISVFNFITAIVTIFSNEPETMDSLSKVQYVLFAGVFAIVISPAHFILGYWPLYQAMRTVNIGRFLLFFMLYLFSALFCFFGVSGWHPYGVSGVITTIICAPPEIGGQGGVAGFVMGIIMCLLWLFMGFFFLGIFISSIVVFRMQNHTFKKVKDFASGQVKRGVGSAISTTVRAATTSDENAV